MGNDRLKDELQKWKAKGGTPAVTSKGAKTPLPSPHTPPPPAPPPRRLSDRELFEQAVADVGDGSVAILKKYGHGHLSGEGEPEATEASGAPEATEGEGGAEPPRERVGGAHLGEAALFLDAVEGARPLAKKAAEPRKKPKPR